MTGTFRNHGLKGDRLIMQRFCSRKFFDNMSLETDAFMFNGLDKQTLHEHATKNNG